MKSKLTNFLSLAVVILVLAALFTVSAFAEISGDFGKIVGLDSTKTYEAAPATINAAGNALAIGEYSDVSASTTGLAGLYYVREKGTTENGTLIYVYGKVSDRQKIGTFEDGSTLPKGITGNADTKFSVGNFLTTTTLYQIKADVSFSNTSQSTKDSWRFMQIYIKPGKNAQEVKDVIAADKAVADLEAQANPDATELANAKAAKTEKRQALANLLKTTYLSYAYASDEIVRASELTSLQYGVNSIQGNVGHYKPSVVFYTVNTQGTIKTYTWNYTGAVIDAYYKQMARHVVVDAAATLASAAADEYVVALQFFPWGNISADEVKIHSTSLTDSYNESTQHGHLFWHKAYTVEKIVPEAPKGLTVNGKTVSGLDKNTSYVAVPVTAAGQGTGIPITAGSTSYTFPDDTVGLWAIAIQGNDYYENSAVGEVLYFEGKYPDRQAILDYDASGVKMTQYEEEFVVGSLSTPSNSTIRHTNGNIIVNVTSGLTKAFNTAPKNEQENAEKKAFFDACIDTFKKLNVKYGYASDEIIPISKASKLTYAMGSHYKPFAKYVGLQPKFIAYVMDKTGKITQYEYTHTAADFSTHSADDWKGAKGYSLYNYSSAIKTVDFSSKTSESGVWTTELPEEGWLVGFEIRPLDNMNDYSKITPGGGINAATFDLLFNFTSEKYEIIVDKAPTPTGITVNEETVSGFASNYNYVAVPITINGADNSKAQDITPVDGKYVFDAATMPGLWGVAIKGDGEYYMNSDTSAPFYIKGSAEARQKIGTFEGGSDYPVFVKDEDYVAGKFIGAGISYPVSSISNTSTAAINGAYGNLAQYIPNSGDGFNLWAYQHTKAEAEAALAAAKEANKKECTGFASDIEEFYTDAFLAKDANTVAAELLALQQKIKSIIQPLTYYYGYASDEIINVSELLNFKIGFKKSQGAVQIPDVQARISFAVMDATGAVTEYSTLTDPYSIINNTASVTFNIDVQSISGLPAEGWIVGFKVEPYAVVDETKMVGVVSFPADERGRVYRFSHSQQVFYFYYGMKDYAIKQDAPTPELSTFPVIGGGFGQISGLNRDYLYEYKYSADGTTWPDNWSEILANSTALDVTDAGFYKVRAKDTADYGKSDVVEIRVIEYEGALDELPYTEPIAKMYLPNDFVELQAEYEIDVTVKNWISTLALQNISTVSPDSTLKINGKNHKFVVKASDIEVDETVHYYNMAVSLFGESRHNVNLEKFKALAGDTYLTDIYFESSKPLPFKNAELNVYLGTEYDGMDVELNLYNEKINRLRSVEVSSVYEGWATFTNCAETYVVVISD